MHMTAIESFIAGSAPWVAEFNAWTATAHPAASADHICYKCGDHAEFERLRALFQAAPFIYQSPIAGRPIALIALPSPISTALGSIRFLELSDQKPDSSQCSGFDHIEIYPTDDQTTEQLCAALEAAGTLFKKVVRPHHTT